MAAGIPGTGIGGLFYAVLALFMPLKKLFTRDRRASPARRWRAVAVQLGLVAGILAAMSATAWVVSSFVRVLRPDPVAADRGLGGIGATLTRATLLASVASLAAVVVLVQVLRLVVRRPATESVFPNSAAEPRARG